MNIMLLIVCFFFSAFYSLYPFGVVLKRDEKVRHHIGTNRGSSLLMLFSFLEIKNKQSIQQRNDNLKLKCDLNLFVHNIKNIFYILHLLDFQYKWNFYINR